MLAAYLLILFVAANTSLCRLITNIKTNVGGPGQSLLRFREAKQHIGVDLLFLGSSHASKGFDNRLFEKSYCKTSFNLGSGLQTPQNSFYILKQYAPIL
ncbi:MAG TPA: hypothetical protein VFF27_11185, partial [Bacteroidia bacterium]|nr:hypothetical protein [Bacteroidia bacterium]